MFSKLNFCIMNYFLWFQIELNQHLLHGLCVHEHADAATFAWQVNTLSLSSALGNSLLKCFCSTDFLLTVCSIDKTKLLIQSKLYLCCRLVFVTSGLLFAQSKPEHTIVLLLLKRKRCTIWLSEFTDQLWLVCGLCRVLS